MSRAKREQKDAAYRIYVTESLRLIPQNQYLTERFGELLSSKQETRTGDEIAYDVIKAAGLKVKDV